MCPHLPASAPFTCPAPCCISTCLSSSTFSRYWLHYVACCALACTAIPAPVCPQHMLHHAAMLQQQSLTRFPSLVKNLTHSHSRRAGLNRSASKRVLGVGVAAAGGVSPSGRFQRHAQSEGGAGTAFPPLADDHSMQVCKLLYV